MKKILALILAAVLCTIALVSCGAADANTITVAASSTPHAEILEQCKPLLEEQGYTLVIRVMSDYITPNTATDSGDVDANYFQHQPYLDSFNAENGTKLNTVVKVHYEPLGIYAGTVSSLDALTDGAIVTIPNDPTNGARALLLLEANGLITLKEGVGINATVNDITEKAIDIEFYEIEAAQLPRVRMDVAMAVINGNYAIESGLSMNDALFVERTDDEVGIAYTNYIVVRPEDAEAEWVEVLREVICSEEVANYINTNEEYAGGVIPSFTVETAEAAE